jgi:hypothetical protein
MRQASCLGYHLECQRYEGRQSRSLEEGTGDSEREAELVHHPHLFVSGRQTWKQLVQS